MSRARLFEIPAAPEARSESSFDYGRVSKAVELLLAARLMLRGHHVSLPLQDDGVDLVVDYRTLVQVKSGAHRSSQGALTIQIDGRRSSERRTNSRKGMIRPDIDVLACYARDTERWWFIPRDAFEGSLGKSSITLTEHLPVRRSPTSLLSSYLDAWDVFLDAGKRGCDHAQVSS